VTSALLSYNTLVFVSEEVRERDWFFEHVRHARLEQRVFDRAGVEVGRVTEKPRAERMNLLEIDGCPDAARAVLGDMSDAKIVELATSAGGRRLLKRRITWGRRLEVTDGAGDLVGTLDVGEFRHRGTIKDKSGETIGTTTAKSRGYLHIAIEDARHTEVGWIADPTTHARRLARLGVPGHEVDIAQADLKLRARQAPWRPHAHVLAITDNVALDFRLVLLAASAGVHLALSSWCGPRE
jgi:hypothetical protein